MAQALFAGYSSPLMRTALRRKMRYYIRSAGEESGDGTGNAGSIEKSRANFIQMAEDFRWAETCFGTDELAQEICWRYAFILDRIANETAGGGDAAPAGPEVALRWCARGIEAAELLADSDLRARIQSALLGRMGFIHVELNQPPEARRYLECAGRLAAAHGTLELSGRIECALGKALSQEGRLQEALLHVQRALELARKAGDTDGEVVAVFHLVQLLRLSGNVAPAFRFWNLIEQMIRTGPPANRSAWLQEAAGLVAARGDFHQAIELYAEAVRLEKELGRRAALLQCELGLGLSYLGAGDRQASDEHLQQALKLVHEDGERDQVQSALALLNALSTGSPIPARADLFLNAWSFNRPPLLGPSGL